MQTHEDRDARRDWLRSLAAKAEQMCVAGESKITAGKEGEPVLGEWKTNGIDVRHLPPDEHGILRISIGGGETPVPLNYCVFRGDHSACVDLLRKALAALERGHGD
ncbi:hypothetical protein LCGC14_0326000 [marine sediment metagenome]|uniref:Uncharacterized protein n=1 Tax=marine sediment metagenome TaxID=412755 RepID=A0A0F9TNF2_9ZZZZ